METYDSDLVLSFEHWRAPLPPLTTTDAGAPRRIGVEIEMIDLDVDRLSAIVAAHVGDGRIDKRSDYEHVIEGDPAGDWCVELDYRTLKEMGRREPPEEPVLALLDDAAERVLRAGAELIVPVEVVTPPLPLERLADVQALIAKLRAAGAKGTRAGLTYAFGMHFNPELPALDAETIARYLKAFVTLYDWLAARSSPDLTRRLTGHIEHYPTQYVRKLVAPSYWPDCATLIDDYLAANPTRNRALDMLPLFAHVDDTRVRAAIDDPLIKARPTLHYRLPNCEIDREHWGIHLAWRDWLEVEKLAADRARLDRWCAHYADRIDADRADPTDWANETEAWLLSR